MTLPRIKYLEIDQGFSMPGKPLGAIEWNGALLDGQYVANADIVADNGAFTVLAKYSGTNVKGFLGFGTRHHFHVVVFVHDSGAFFISKKSYKALNLLSMVEGTVYFLENFTDNGKKYARQLVFNESNFEPFEAFETEDAYGHDSYMNFEDLGILDNHPEQLRSLLDSYKGAVIEDVFYSLPNYPERQCEYHKFHTADMAVMIQFNSGKKLNWVWLEQTEHFHLSTKDIFTILDMNFPDCLEDVSESPDWKQLIYGKVTSIDFALYDGQLSDLIITTQTGMAQICATEEPDPEALPELQGLPIANEWAVVVFDKDLLQQHSRLK